MPTPLVIASANPHKVDEFRAILAPLAPHFAVVGLRELEAGGHGPFHEPDETGQSFEHNAAIKALAYAARTGQVCIADDSGLEIDALGGRPGVISSHYFNDGRTDGPAAGMARERRDHLNNGRVLAELAGVPFERRTARFVCVLAVAGCGRHARDRFRGSEPSLLTTFRATFEGRIGLPAPESSEPALMVPRGRHGFGYDPLFLVAPDFTRTSAELSSAEKNATSHRARAAAHLLDWLARGNLDRCLGGGSDAALNEPEPAPPPP